MLADGPGNAQGVLELDLANYGGQPLTVTGVTFTGATGVFSVTGLSAGKMVQPAGVTDGASTLPFSIVFDPSQAGSFATTLTIATNDPNSPLTVALIGSGASVHQQISVQVPDNNVGGVDVATGPETVAKFGTITNTGNQPLTITKVIQDPQFSVTGLPSGFGPGNPLVLAPGASQTFSLVANLQNSGLQRGMVQFLSDDPATPDFQLHVDATGIAAGGPKASFAMDYVAITLPNLSGGTTLRGLTDSSGNFSFFLPPDQAYEVTEFDPTSGLVAHGAGRTATSGRTTLVSQPNFRASTANDTNGDGLPDDIKFAIGTSLTKSDSNGDGIDDFTSIQEGLNPLANVSFPTGVIASLPLKGEAQSIALTGSISSQSGQTAYVATGSYGLAIVNASQFNKPVVQGQIALSGTSTAVAVNTVDNLAIVASGPGGVNLVDVTDPTNPTLVQTVKLPAGAQGVVYFDGLAYVASGPSLVTIDPLTGEIAQTLSLGGGQITGLAREGSFLYTMDDRNTLSVVDISGFVMVARGSVSLPSSFTLASGSDSLLVANGIAYVGLTRYLSTNGLGVLAGYVTIDVSNPDKPAYLNDLPTSDAAGQAVDINGSGIALTVGSDLNGPAVDVFDSTDPTKSGQFITRYALSVPAVGVSIASGLAYVAEGSSGLQVVNYESFDNKGVPPTVSITSPVADADPNTPGVQVVEGTDVPITVAASDDVQVRNVLLLVNGKVVDNAVSLPYNLDVVVPSIASAGGTLTVQVEAFDTGGNKTLSNILSFGVMRDTVPPQVVSTTPAAGADVYYTPSIDLNFSKPLDSTVLNASGFSLLALGVGGVPGNGNGTPVAISKVELHTLGHTVSVYPTTVLDTGNFELIVDPSVISDRAGNHPSAPITLLFTIHAASDIHPLSGFPTIYRAPAANVGQEIAFHIPNATSNTLITFPTNTNGSAGTVNVAPAKIDTTNQVAYYTVPDNATTGNLTINVTDSDFPLYLQVVPTLTAIYDTSGGVRRRRHIDHGDRVHGGRRP